MVHHAGRGKLVQIHPRERPGERHLEPGRQRVVQDHRHLGRAAGPDLDAAARLELQPELHHDDGAPLLWIASNGHLKGYGGSATTISSPSAVNNGAWHQAVLIPGQALYLDGVKVATATAGFSPAEHRVRAAQRRAWWEARWAPHGPISTGHWPTCRSTTTSCPASGTVAAQYAAETQPAAELTSVTSPAGRTELSATYNIVNDRVASLTDADGGNWAYSGPVPGSSTAAYVSTVMGSSPEDFWPLSDTAGPLAHDLVGAPRPPPSRVRRPPTRT